MKVQEVRDLSDDQLDDKLRELKREQFNLRFRAATGQLEDTARFRILRRTIARIKTIARQRQRAKITVEGEPASVAAE